MRGISRASASYRHWIAVSVLGVLIVLATISLAAAQEGEGYWYIVRAGDSWASIAARTGVSVAELQRANPHAIHPRLWLYRGERLWIPLSRAEGYWYTVQRGDSWTSIARRTGISVRRLQQANPQAVRRSGWLYRGERIWIPAPAATPAAEVKPVILVTPTPIAPCPEQADSYLSGLARMWTQEDIAIEAVRSWAAGCGLVDDPERQVMISDLTADGKADLIAAVVAPGSASDLPASDVVVLSGEDATPVLQTRVAGKVSFLAARDINEDSQPDLVWLETACGVHTCFGTVSVASWTGSAFESWIEGKLTMAAPEVRIDDVSPGQGDEIIVHGGVIGSIGAGPQRAWTEIWASIDGGPYAFQSRSFDPSPCLYHAVLDGNYALLRGSPDDLAEAVEHYRRALEDDSLTACWVRPNEVAELRSFAAFRLAMAYAYLGDTAQAQAAIERLQTDYPDSVYAQIGDIWWTAYEPTGDMAAACAAVDAFVAEPDPHPEAYEILSDYGYANPSFAAGDVCPVLPQP